MQRSAARPERAGGPFGHRRQLDVDPPQRRQQTQNLLGLAALRERDHHVVGPDSAEIAVDRLGRVERERPGAGGRQRRGQLLAHEPRLAHAGDDHAPLAAVNHPGRSRDRAVQPLANPPQRLGFNPKHLAGEGDSLGFGLGLRCRGRIRDQRHRGPPCPDCGPFPIVDSGWINVRRNHSPSPRERQRRVSPTLAPSQPPRRPPPPYRQLAPIDWNDCGLWGEKEEA